MRSFMIAGVLSVALLQAACGHRSSADVTLADGGSAPVAVARKDPASIRVTEEDITDKKYISVGDISVSVSKNNLFEADPTPQMVKSKLAEKAAELGADAVVFARYGTVGMSAFSWGSIDGKGRAVRYVP